MLLFLSRFLRKATLAAPLAALLSVGLLLPSAAGGTLPLPSEESVKSITAQDLKRHLSFLASEELGGRYTLSPSNRIAARYLASELEYYGFRGGAKDGSYFQKVPLGMRKIDAAASSLFLQLDSGKKQFRCGEDFAARQPIEARAEGPLVFVGFGISAPKNGWDDYAEVDARGKIVVALMGMPQGLKDKRVAADDLGEAAAQAHGAAGELLIPASNYPAAWERLRSGFATEELGFAPRASESDHQFASAFIGPEVVKALSEAIGKDLYGLNSPEGRSYHSMAIPGSSRLEIKVQAKESFPAQNVVGILEGSDPQLKDQYVVFSAHYDHLATRQDGAVYKGADDDGSGTVSVLEIARAFSIGTRPKRSILIIFHTGEELGLFGSEYNTDYDPVIPLKKLVVDLNIDMIGRSKPPKDDDPRDALLTDKNSIYLIGADRLSTELDKLSRQTNDETEHLRLDYLYNDDANPERFYYRSDHYNYAKHGIPVIFFFTGVHRDYHQVTDDVSKIDFEKMTRIDRFIFATGWRIANLDHRLVVDKATAVELQIGN